MSEAVSVVLRGQEFAARLFIDRCIIDRPGAAVMDPVTLKMTPTYDVIYSADGSDDGAPCKVQQAQNQAAEAESAGRVHTIQDSRLDFPVGVPVKIGDRVTIVSAVIDPSLAGKVYRLEEANTKSYLTAQRWKIQEVTS